MNYWIEKGAPPRKIVMGVPVYGQSFTLSDAKNNGLNAKAPGPGQAGEYTRAAGCFISYFVRSLLYISILTYFCFQDFWHIMK